MITVGGMKSCRLRVVFCQDTQKLRWATTFEYATAPAMFLPPVLWRSLSCAVQEYRMRYRPLEWTTTVIKMSGLGV